MINPIFQREVAEIEKAIAAIRKSYSQEIAINHEVKIGIVEFLRLCSGGVSLGQCQKVIKHCAQDIQKSNRLREIQYVYPNVDRTQTNAILIRFF